MTSEARPRDPAPPPASSVLGAPPAAVAYPEGIAELVEGPYAVRFARGAADLAAVLMLRFEVFNRELGEGLAASWSTGLDRDRFDARCHHLLLEERATGRVVGTYRLQPASDPRAELYCAGEFDLAPLAPIVARGVELGRACIAREHRQRSALFALWRGLAAYLAWCRARYLFGCCSLTSTDPRAGRALHRTLERAGHVHPRLVARALPALACEAGAADGVPEPVVELPKLFGTYLRYGGKVCSEPALDREFKTIDWLVVLDARGLPARLWRLFFTGLLRAPEELAE